MFSLLPAQAEDVDALREELRRMQERVQSLAEKIEQLEAEQARAEQEGVQISGDKLQIQTADGEFKFRVGGRLQMDAAWYDDDGDTELGNGTEIRRARLRMEGTVFRHWDFRNQFDFAPGDSVTVQDAYIRYTGFEQGRVTLGHFKEHFGLENLTSDNYITFMERGLPDVFTPGRNLGVAVDTTGAFRDSGEWTAAGGFFGEGFDAPGDDVDEGYGASGRVTLAPIAEKTRVAHLGAALSWRTPDANDMVRFRQRPESHVTNVRLVDTGSFRADDYLRFGAEAAGVYGPLSLQGEYMFVDVDSSTARDPGFQGWYVYGSYFLTGESRPYGGGDFGRVKPNSNFPGGPGAWELGLRFSSLDLTDKAIVGGEEDNLTVGVNWYTNSYIRFMANYLQVLNLDRPGDPADGDEPGVFQLRGQVIF
ncbi:MAG: porin [Gammaproteobacteria bacterium]|nr:porin [Gammaproteobacteria bacterium]NIR82827.1 porin [Gammaproteobacteria bacterium]NIR89936.1 porin [Gammaproteobacteria bacterium]NIU03985.1 porin [Gammaproteobacteria bacterium]NIV51305.1 porin [Gammaproteobacteria bacterium]